MWCEKLWPYLRHRLLLLQRWLLWEGLRPLFNVPTRLRLLPVFGSAAPRTRYDGFRQLQPERHTLWPFLRDGKLVICFSGKCERALQGGRGVRSYVAVSGLREDDG